ncbi:hypothetical protein LR48_Vigan09g090300 [Vigna angularis]|uniref:Uncharacterized protein n=1 Tax=Phaseolus angularis TaxID=3914 RepID=A0A0L9VC55_PHAAN|nr:hypothetical protein LR48_Vigan09g090300 [Vigna angularis]
MLKMWQRVYTYATRSFEDEIDSQINDISMAMGRSTATVRSTVMARSTTTARTTRMKARSNDNKEGVKEGEIDGERLRDKGITTGKARFIDDILPKALKPSRIGTLCEELRSGTTGSLFAQRDGSLCEKHLDSLSEGIGDVVKGVVEVQNEYLVDVENEDVVEVENEDAVDVENDDAVEVENEDAVEVENEDGVEVENEDAVEGKDEAAVEVQIEDEVEFPNPFTITATKSQTTRPAMLRTKLDVRRKDS